MSDYLTDDEVRNRFAEFGQKHPNADWELYHALANRGHSDADILRMTPDEMFDEFCMWHGLINWGPTLRHIIDRATEGFA